MILATAIAAHFIFYKADNRDQIAIGVGKGATEHVLFLIPDEGCGNGMKVFQGNWGDLDAVTDLLAYSNVCDRFNKRR